MNHRFHITTGDLDGIGLEVTLKSLIAIVNKSSQCNFIIWIHSSQQNEVQVFLKKYSNLSSKSRFITLSDLKEKKLSKFNFLVHPDKTPAHWFKIVSNLCLTSKDSVITGPLSKTQIQSEGINLIGHTEILKLVTKKNDLNMAFVGKYFSMILFTGHIPIYKVKYNSVKFKKFLNLSLNFHKTTKNQKSKFNILGLNPHAGDNGLIGLDDIKILKDVKKVFGIDSLLPADSAFINYKKLKNNPTYVSFYHDQGLIPFKMAHGFTGYHFTLGLPFVRTSVDHGTAKELFQLNKADPTSMIDAIIGAINLKKRGI